MQVFIAQHAGFCEGVERAFNIAIETARAGQPVYMLGNLVHNKLVVERLKSAGVKAVANLDEIPLGSNGVLLISAHGVAPEIYAKAKQIGLEIIDTTCPWVKKAQKIAKQLANDGRTVIIIGDKGHPEVKGLVGWSSGQAVVVENKADLAELPLKQTERVGIIAQTTQPTEHFAQMVKEIKKLVNDAVEHNTICDATSKRQAAAVAIAKKVELMLVIGDKLSANTKRLTELCAATGVETHQLENVNELNGKWLALKSTVGLTAGASTPDWVIQAILDKLKLL